VVALTYDARVQRQLALLYGVTPLLVEPLEVPREMKAVLNRVLTERGLAAPGDLIVVVSSTRPRTPGATDATLVHRIE
jgi:pyruvate kinase